MIDWSIIAKAFASEAAKRTFSALKKRKLDKTPSESSIAHRLRRHLVEAANWAAEIQFFGMTKPSRVADQSVPLKLDTVPRKFRGNRKGTPRLEELDLLAPGQNHLILGDPGSGKTTTLKRLTVHLLLGEPRDSEPWDYPIVMRLRYLDSALDIFEHIARILGIEYEKRAVSTETVDFGLVPEGKAAAEAPDFTESVQFPAECFVGGERLEDVISTLLDETSAIILIDGLDEVSLKNRHLFDRSIQALALRLASAKLIVSCRSGDYYLDYQGFSVVELCPLDADQIQYIASKWIDEPVEFLTRIKRGPYADLVTRPLFLCQLLVYFNNVGDLPDRAASISQTVVRLLLEDWDRRRGVRRGSRYAAFKPDDKLEFLAAVAYHLTYRFKAKRFTRDTMREIYFNICEGFQLPKSEMDQVVVELETHTGILVESGPEHYEFSHLSLQEYLCAHYIVRDVSSEHLRDYYDEHPAPLAVAASMAANPSTWFASLVLERIRSIGYKPMALRSLISRLYLEQPRFVRSVYLGFALVDIVLAAGEKVETEIKDLAASQIVRDSIRDALSRYDTNKERSSDSVVWLRLRKSMLDAWTFPPPGEGPFPRALFAFLSRPKTKDLTNGG